MPADEEKKAAEKLARQQAKAKAAEEEKLKKEEDERKEREARKVELEKKRKEEEMICKICGESGHFTQV